ncbi:YbaB/EbfC family nucleoid-associated protein [Streptococcus thoraltensis]
MMNMQNMMKQAQKLQKQMEKKQEELTATTFTGKSAQDLVVVEFSGDKKLTNITFAEAVVDPEDVETLQDMTAQALNDAFSQIDAATQKTMGAFANKLPF